MMLESYEFVETLAQSQTTIVARAIRKRDGLPVVLKGTSREYPSARELGRLEFEYRILRKLEAPNIVRALALEKQGNGLALVLEDYGGSSLALHAAGLLPLELFFDVAIALARTLGYVHERHVIHKDISLSNILMNQATSEIKLIDFGIASELSQEHQGADLAAQLEGTLPYMSPEQTGRMNRDLDYRTDYYSLGVALFELLTGSLPFTASDVMGWVHCHISKPAPSARAVNPRVPEALARVVRKLMAKNPGERYQSAYGIVRDLEQCRAAGASGAEAMDFKPGREDVSERFQLSQTLFGREAEAKVLKRAFERASAGRATLLLVTGYSGVGKSALIHELHKDVVAHHGRFVEGKFDQLERNVPYAALLQAVRALIRVRLREPEASLRQWRERVSAALGPNARVLVEFIPELEQALGPQPPVPALRPREAQARFQRAFTEFLKTTAERGHPLVLFLDDLQWADPSTPELLVHLLSDDQLQHLLLIGSYRDNELHAGHFVLSALEQIRTQEADAVIEISLLPLAQASVNQIVAETLRCDLAVSAPLAALIWQKTAGNPFFVKELLNLLARAGSFRFVAAEGRWDWDYDAIRAAAVSDNVVDLMVQRLQQLPEATIEMLRLAAAVGNEFDLQTLTLLAQEPAGKIAARLRSAVEERVLIPEGGGYRFIQDDQDYDLKGLSTLAIRYKFQHDRVQQAAYSLLTADDRAMAHLRVGRMLLAAHGEGRVDIDFEIVNHLNLGRSLITTLAERLDLLRLNEAAGRRAKRATAYAIARAYFETGAALLSPEEWAARAQAHFDCRREAIECIFYSGEPERALTRCQELLAGAPDKSCRVAALELEARILDQQGRLTDAIRAFRTALELLGLSLPEDPAAIQQQIGEGIGKMQAHLARVPIEDLVKLPEMHDEEKIRINSLLFQLVIPAIQCNPPLFLLAELMMFDLALTHGTTPMSCKNFVDCGIIQGPILGDYARAYQLGKIALEFLERGSAKAFASGVSFVFATFVSPWRAHYQESLDAYADAERWGLELGDVAHTIYTHALSSQRWFFVGLPLDACQSKLERSMACLKQAGADNQLNGVAFVQRALDRLRASPEDQASLRGEPDQEFTERLLATRNGQWLFMHGCSQALVSVVLREFASAEQWLALSAQYVLTGGNIHFSLVDYHLLDSLVCAVRCASAADAERATWLERLSANEAKLQNWAIHCPANFDHKYKLAVAESARARGESLQVVLALYQAAVLATGDDFVHMRALANERLADYWATRGEAKIARVFLEEAYFHYERWGATAKLQQLRQDLPQAGAVPPQLARSANGAFATQHRTSHLLDETSLDIESMIKATRMISGEVKPDRLFARLMATIVENAGAQRACLVLESEQNHELSVEAAVSADGETRLSQASRLIEHSLELCPSIIRYVARTFDTVVLDDATRDARYRDDAYVSANGIRSVLCMPVLNQGKLVAILYAENNAASHAFTTERLKLLEVIAAQAAVSITNARLYDNLEVKVAERTRELTEKSAEVSAMLNSLQQGVFTVDESLGIQPPYSPYLEQILGTTEVTGKNCIDLLFRDADLREDTIASMRSALEFSFGTDRILAEINWVYLVKEFERRLADGRTQDIEVDWNPIVGEDDTVRKMLVAVRDVTTLKQLHAIAARNARELEMVGQILDAGATAFLRFCATAHDLTAEVLSALRSDLRPSRAMLDLAFRNMHTIKGNARMLELSELVDVVHATEGTYDELRSRAGSVGDKAVLEAGITEVLAALAEYEEICRRKLGDGGGEQDKRLADAVEKIGTVLDDAARGSLRPEDALAGIGATLKLATAVPLQAIVTEAGRMLPSIARELGKSDPSLDCTGTGLLLEPTWARLVRDALVQTFRNCIDHGIEPMQERQALDKPASGRISVHAVKAASGACVRVTDDGRGLRLAALRSSSQDQTETDEEIAERVFASGVSTADKTSKISGRGVGLDVVRSSLRRQGGDARICFTGGHHDGCRPFDLMLDLPEKALVLVEQPLSVDLSRSVREPTDKDKRLRESRPPPA